MNGLRKADERLTGPPADLQEVRQARQIVGRYLRCVREVTHRHAWSYGRSEHLTASGSLVSYVRNWDYGYIMTVMWVSRLSLPLTVDPLHRTHEISGLRKTRTVGRLVD